MPEEIATRLLSLLENYGRHHAWCARAKIVENASEPDPGCNCGFAAELKRAQQEVFPSTYGAVGANG